MSKRAQEYGDQSGWDMVGTVLFPKESPRIPSHQDKDRCIAAVIRKKNTKQTVPIRFSIYLVLAKSGNWRFSLIERSFTYRLIKRGDKGFCFGGPSLSSLPNVFAQNNNVMGV